MRCSIYGLLVGVLLFAASAEAQQARPGAPTGVALLDQARQMGWNMARDMTPKLEAADKAMYPGLHALAADVRRVEQSIDVTKSPHEWPAIDTDALLVRN